MHETTDIRATFEGLVAPLAEACEAVYGRRLMSFAIFGSVGRGSPRPDSDIDLLIVAEPLPRGRMARVREFDAVERRLSEAVRAASSAGVHTRLSPVLKTPAEVGLRTPLLLDLVHDARILVDREDFLAGTIADLTRRLEALGARRIWRGSAWYWDLKPDYRQGEVFEL
ncbi:MAG: nucleotidyltransferase domain-containing protein [Thermoanaerobaculia bacterium]